MVLQYINPAFFSDEQRARLSVRSSLYSIWSDAEAAAKTGEPGVADLQRASAATELVIESLSSYGMGVCDDKLQRVCDLCRRVGSDHGGTEWGWYRGQLAWELVDEIQNLKLVFRRN